MKFLEAENERLRKENEELAAKLSAVLTDPVYEGGVQFWIKKHDVLAIQLAEALAKLAARQSLVN